MMPKIPQFEMIECSEGDMRVGAHCHGYHGGKKVALRVTRVRWWVRPILDVAKAFGAGNLAQWAMQSGISVERIHR